MGFSPPSRADEDGGLKPTLQSWDLHKLSVLLTFFSDRRRIPNLRHFSQEKSFVRVITIGTSASSVAYASGSFFT